jgi:hypothetical protein
MIGPDSGIHDSFRICECFPCLCALVCVLGILPLPFIYTCQRDRNVNVIPGQEGPTGTVMVIDEERGALAMYSRQCDPCAGEEPADDPCCYCVRCG